MSKNERDILGLPKQFSTDPRKHKIEVLDAIFFGGRKVQRVFGETARTTWSPSPENTLIAWGRDRLINIYAAHTGLSKEQATQFVDTYNASAISNNANRKTFYDASKLTTPFDAAIAGAHEAVHQSGENKRPGFKSSMREFFRNADSKKGAERVTYEFLVQMCAFEALRLLELPITRLPNRTRITEAYKFLTLKQLTVPLGDNASTVTFKLSQGIRDPELDELDIRMGYHPTAGWNSYSDYGILYPTAVLQSNLPVSIKEQQVVQVIEWQRARGIDNIDILRRFDFRSTAALLRSGRA